MDLELKVVMGGWWNWIAGVVLILILGLGAGGAWASPKATDDLLEMSLDELMDLEVDATASLTKTSRRRMPATVTTIDRNQIRQSGARSLYELMDIFVPNCQMIFGAAKLRHLGLRGIVSSRDDKYLLLVNNRVMNEKTDFGVMTERDLPMLSDIHHVDIVRGPGSALYGPGALAMVINIVTDDGTTFQGSEVRGRLGIVESFYSGEYKYGKQYNEDTGVFVFAGATKYVGADTSDSPMVAGRSVSGFGGRDYGYRERIKSTFHRSNAAWDNQPKWKLHGQVNKGPLELWCRYTMGGEHNDQLRDKNGVWYYSEGEAYRQFTVYTSYDQVVSPELSIQYAFSYDNTNVETLDGVWRPKSFRENEFYTRAIASYKPHEQHSFACGYEWSHEQFGRQHMDSQGMAILYHAGKLYRKPFSQATPMPKWSTDMHSVVGEYQWLIHEQLTAFLSSRVDWHDFTPRMWSPRAALVYSPDARNTFRFIASRSSRTNTAYEMRAAANSDPHTKSDPEILRVYEVRYEHRPIDALLLASGGFYHDHDIIGWASNQGARPLGNVKSYGIEVEASYQTKKTRIEASHGYTEMTEFTKAPGLTSTLEFTSADQGYGNDLANWDNHISKLVLHRELSEKVNLDTSLYVYWGSPGGQDFADYRASVSSSVYVSGFKEPFTPAAFWNLGFEIESNEHLTWRIDGHNLLGMYDKELNKKRIGFNTQAPGQYRMFAPSATVSCIYKF